MLADLAGSDPASWRRPGSWRKRTPAVTVVVRRPGGPLAGLVTSLTYRTGEQPRTSVEKILPSPETGLWVNLNRDAFRSFGWSGDVRQVPGTMVSGPIWPGSWRKRTPAVTVVVRRPGGPLAGLVTSLTYRTGEQPRTSVEKILPSPETGLWVNLNRDAFRSFGWSGDVRQVPGTMVSG